MRTIPVLNRKVLEQSSAGEAFLAFVTVSHPQMIEAIRLVLDGADYVIGSDTFHKSFFEIDLVSDDESPPKATFRFSNVDRVAITMLRSVASPPRVALDLISTAYFDLTVDPRTVKPATTVEYLYRARGLFLTGITADSIAVEGTLRGWDFRQESWPDKRVTQTLLPGAFVR
jgi:hypothetical protein